MKIEIIPEAQDDILRAMFWYEEKKLGLGLDFFSEIEKNISLIAQNPEIGYNFVETLRRFVMRQFPFCIYYSLDVETVIFLGFLHAHGDPNKIAEWLDDRTKSRS